MLSLRFLFRPLSVVASSTTTAVSESSVFMPRLSSSNESVLASELERDRSGERVGVVDSPTSTSACIRARIARGFLVP
jgi:TctA family transporter